MHVCMHVNIPINTSYLSSIMLEVPQGSYILCLRGSVVWKFRCDSWTHSHGKCTCLGLYVYIWTCDNWNSHKFNIIRKVKHPPTIKIAAFCRALRVFMPTTSPLHHHFSSSSVVRTLHVFSTNLERWTWRMARSVHITRSSQWRSYTRAYPGLCPH